MPDTQHKDINSIVNNLLLATQTLIIALDKIMADDTYPQESGTVMYGKHYYTAKVAIDQCNKLLDDGIDAFKMVNTSSDTSKNEWIDPTDGKVVGMHRLYAIKPTTPSQ